MRLVVDRQGSDPEAGAQAHLRAARRPPASRSASSARRSLARPAGPLGSGGAPRWNLAGLGHIDHRKVVVVDGRIGWVGGAGIEDHFQDGRFHDLFLRVDRARRLAAPARVPRQLPLARRRDPRGRSSTALSRSSRRATRPCRRSCSTTRRAGSARSPTRSRGCSTARSETLDVVNPYVTDRGMIRRIEQAARRGVRVRLFVPANANNWACAAAQQFHHARLLDAGVRILDYPTMLHAKAFVRDGEERPGRHVQPRGVEPEAVLRDRPARPLAAPSRRSSTSGSASPRRPRRRRANGWPA